MKYTQCLWLFSLQQSVHGLDKGHLKVFGICQSFQGLLNFSISLFKEILNWSYDVAKSVNSLQSLADTCFLLLCRLWRLTSLLLTNTRNQSSWSGDRNSRKRLPSWRRTSNTTRTASTPWWWSVKGQYTGSKVKVKDKNLRDLICKIQNSIQCIIYECAHGILRDELMNLSNWINFGAKGQRQQLIIRFLLNSEHWYHVRVPMAYWETNLRMTYCDQDYY